MHNFTWKDSIKMYLKEIGCVGMDWISVARGGDKWQALVNRVLDIPVSYDALII
jgi:hypothetical protein